MLRWTKYCGRRTIGLVGLVLTAGLGRGQVIKAPALPQPGSANTVAADAPVIRPATKSCIVHLLHETAFNDFNPRPFTYDPAENKCKGPWAKVIFTGDFTVQTGRQFDRTASVFMGNANLYFGTTAEPRRGLSPSWHVERDVTELSSLFTSVQTGQANLGNFVGTSGGVKYNSIIFANFSLEFYEASASVPPAAAIADVVVGLVPGNQPATINAGTPKLVQTVTLPKNVERVYLDVISQSQNQEEQWFLCVPDNVTATVQSCGGGGLRETDVAIDGYAAGVAPVYPWIYTGGLDPYLWEPIPGVQTLNFKPYRVDLSPFAGLLADGNAHTITIGVYKAFSYFEVAGTLLAYVDHGTTQVTGAIVSDSLSLDPSPLVNEDLSTGLDGTISGSVTVSAQRMFAIHGYVATSHGRVDTTIEQSIDFSNAQQFVVNSSQYTQNLVQQNMVADKTTVQNGLTVTVDQKQVSYPFTLELTDNFAADGSIAQPTTVSQGYFVTEQTLVGGVKTSSKTESNQVLSNDTSLFAIVNGGYTVTKHTGESSQNYFTSDSAGDCYSRSLTAVDSRLSGYKDGVGCPGGRNHW